MKFKTAAVAATVAVSAFTSYAGDSDKAANNFRNAAKEYAQQAEQYYKKAGNTKGKERQKLLSVAKMSDQLSEIKLKMSDAARRGDWDTVTQKLMKEYQKINTAKNKLLWGDHKDKSDYKHKVKKLKAW